MQLVGVYSAPTTHPPVAGRTMQYKTSFLTVRTSMAETLFHLLWPGFLSFYLLSFWFCPTVNKIWMFSPVLNWFSGGGQVSERSKNPKTTSFYPRPNLSFQVTALSGKTKFVTTRDFWGGKTRHHGTTLHTNCQPNLDLRKTRSRDYSKRFLWRKNLIQIVNQK